MTAGDSVGPVGTSNAEPFGAPETIFSVYIDFELHKFIYKLYEGYRVSEFAY